MDVPVAQRERLSPQGGSGILLTRKEHSDNGEYVMRSIVIGYGSKLRGDDALGPHIVENLHDTVGMESMDVHIISLPQLDLSLAPRISESDMVIFVDAREDGGEVPVEIQQIEPLTGPVLFSHTSHAMGVPLLLQIARDWYGAVPICYMVMPKGYDFTISETLSEKAEIAAVQARNKILEILQSQAPSPLIGEVRRG